MALCSMLTALGSLLLVSFTINKQPYLDINPHPGVAGVVTFPEALSLISLMPILILFQLLVESFVRLRARQYLTLLQFVTPSTSPKALCYS